ncbi:AI-2E family transporter [Flavobacterium sp. NG2]|uniref:AI-2E family transporter n=1 Tax=Flavobacterium sp. NG2 TaxID=3097547 RepID=UPI002A83674D|nr:AI-2E family transporter [Flavobacterium sp. NG2]WPR70249.1 AI-2E family transporter [Flavobacterium sp. NG2]
MNTTAKRNHLALDLLSFISIVFLSYILQDFLIPLIFAIILSVLIYPIVQFFESRLYFNRIVSISIAIIIFTFIIFAIFVLIGIQFEEIMNKSDAYYKQIGQKLTPLLAQTEQSTGINSKDIVGDGNLGVKEIVKKNSNKIVNFITTSGSILGDFVLSPLYMFLFLLYRNFLVSFIYKITTGISTKQHTRVILQQLYKVQQNYLLGLVSVMAIVGLLNSLGLLILGIEHPFFFGFLCALLLLVPYIGIIIGSLLPALIALATKDSYWYAIGVIGIFGFIQFIEGNFITPKITGSKVSLNAFVSILSIVLFSMLWGIPGMILALPITASLKVLFDHSERMKPIGFLLGEAKQKYFSIKTMNRLKTWKKIRTKKNKKLIN